MTTQDDIRGWLKSASRQAATHLIVVCDTFSHEDYPVYVSTEQDVQVRMREFTGENMQRIMEVYAMHLPLEDQLREHRAMHPEYSPEMARLRQARAENRREMDVILDKLGVALTEPAKKKTPKKKVAKKRAKKRKTIWDRIRKPEL